MNYKKTFKPIFKERHIIEIISIVVLLVIASLFKISVDHVKDTIDTGGGNLASLYVNFDSMQRQFEGEVVEDMTILDALNMAMAAGKIKLNYSLDENNRTTIMEINDHLNHVGGRQFAFYLNDKKVDSGDLNKTELKAGNEVVIKYE